MNGRHHNPDTRKRVMSLARRVKERTGWSAREYLIEILSMNLREADTFYVRNLVEGNFETFRAAIRKNSKLNLSRAGDWLYEQIANYLAIVFSGEYAEITQRHWIDPVSAVFNVVHGPFESMDTDWVDATFTGCLSGTLSYADSLPVCDREQARQELFDAISLRIESRNEKPWYRVELALVKKPLERSGSVNTVLYDGLLTPNYPVCCDLHLRDKDTKTTLTATLHDVGGDIVFSTPAPLTVIPCQEASWLLRIGGARVVLEREAIGKTQGVRDDPETT